MAQSSTTSNTGGTSEVPELDDVSVPSGCAPTPGLISHPTAPTSGKAESSTEGNGQIQVIFNKWVPGGPGDTNTTPIPTNESRQNDEQADGGYVMPKNNRSGRVRYYQMYNKHGRVRPGLGLTPEMVAESMPHHIKKRKKAGGSGGAADVAGKRIKLTPEKPPTAYLNEMSPPNLQFNFEDKTTDASHPCFSCSVIYPPEPRAEGVMGEEFVGEGRSKKLAKNDVSLKILKSLGVICEGMDSDTEISSPDNFVKAQNQERTMPFESGQYPYRPVFDMWNSHMNQIEIDFSSDDVINQDFSQLARAPFESSLAQPMVNGALLSRLKNIPNFNENTCLALHTLIAPNTVSYNTISDEGPPHDKKFKIEVTFNNNGQQQSFIGEGSSKKKSKAAAARQGVISLLGIDCYHHLVRQSPIFDPQQQQGSMPLSTFNANQQHPDGEARPGKKKKKSKRNMPLDVGETVGAVDEEGEDEDDAWGEYDLNFSDHVSNVVREKFEELMGDNPNYSAFKVLAGVVMTTGSPMIYNSQVIAVTTGTKCIEGDFMSTDGLSVNDCHAEILATRCVRDYLYSQIECLESSKSDKELTQCILQLNQDAATQSQQKYQLKDDVKFHLYINTSPCGDARIFSPKGLEVDDDEASLSPQDLEDTHPNKINRGVLRSKIEAGEGTIPSANLYAGPQTWDSIVSGNALYTMSCSDKVCRWNVLGMQGALLYNLLGSIYYSSITLGSLHHPVHFTRAVYGRVEPLGSRLEIPFRINKPKLMMVTRPEKRKVKKSPNHAVCWSVNWSTAEVLAASKGRCEPGGVASRLSKRLAFGRFLNLYNNVSGRRDNYADLTYHEAKQLAAGYQKAKEEFVTFFKESKLGPWIGKPLEQDCFKIK